MRKSRKLYRNKTFIIGYFSMTAFRNMSSCTSVKNNGKATNSWQELSLTVNWIMEILVWLIDVVLDISNVSWADISIALL